MSQLALQLFLLVNVFCIGVIVTLAVQHARAHFRPQKPQPSTTALSPEAKSRLVHAAEHRFELSIERANKELDASLTATTSHLSETLEKLVSTVISEEMDHYRKSLNDLNHQNEALLKRSLTDTTAQQTDLKTKLLQRQSELDSRLMSYQNELETDLALHQSELEKKLVQRQEALDDSLMSQQQAYEAHQAELEAKLREHHTQLTSALDERESKLAQYEKDLEAEMTEHQTKHAALQHSLEATLAADITAKKEFLSSQVETKLADAVSSLLVETLGHNVDLGAQTPYLTAVLEEHKAELAKGVRDDV